MPYLQSMSDSRGHDQRAQSELLGIILLFALVITVSLTVVVVGSQAITDSRASTEMADTRNSLSEFQAAIAGMSASGGSNVKSVKFTGAKGVNAGRVDQGKLTGGTRGDPTVKPDKGSIQVKVNGNSILPDGDPVKLGAIEVNANGQVLAYQGGGIFRRSSGSQSSTLVSPPPFSYQYRSGTPTISLPINTIATNSGEKLDGRGFSLKTVSSTKHFPSSSLANPLSGADSVTITVQSGYYQAWGSLFKQRTGAMPAYDHANNEVSITLSGAPAPSPDVAGALSASTGSCCSQIFFDHKTRVKSYHSTTPPATGAGTTKIDAALNWATGGGSGMGPVDGDLIVAEYIRIDSNTNSNQVGVGGETIVGDGGQTKIKCKGCEFGKDLPSGADAMHVNDDLKLTGHSNADLKIYGNVYVEGDLEAGSNVHIKGDLHVGGNFQWDSGMQVDGTVRVGGSDNGWGAASNPQEPEEPTFVSRDSVSPKITKQGTNWDAGNNDDVDSDMIDGIETSSHCDTSDQTDADYCSLPSGNYYVNSLTVASGQTIEFDTTTGPINIYVDSGVNFNGGDVKVTGAAPVRVYNNGDFNFNSGNIITDHAPNYAPGFWMYMHDDKGITIGSDGFTGVIYAPGEDDGLLNINGKNIDIYGAIIGEMSNNIPKKTTFHFDEALLGQNGNPSAGLDNEGETIGFLHVSTAATEVSESG